MAQDGMDAGGRPPETSEVRLEPVRFIARVDAVLRFGTMMLGAGASSARVRAVMDRAAHALGIEQLESSVGMTEIVLTARGAGIYRTRVAEVRPAINAARITALKRLSHTLPDGTDARELQADLDRIEQNGPLYPMVLRAAAAGAACAAFSLLLGGGWPEWIAVGIAAAIGQTVRMLLARAGVNEFLLMFVSAVAALALFLGITALLDLWGAPTGRHEAALTSAVLYLVPGFALVTGALDLARLDFLAGVGRVVYASLALLATGGAVWAVAALVHTSPAAGADPLYDEPVLSIARLLAGYIGVVGFALLFSTPWRIAAVAAVLGAVANLGRLLLIDAAFSPVMAAAIAALAVGLGASLVGERMRAARVTITVPAVLIMIPGAASYRAIAATIDGDTLTAVQQGAEAVFVVIALAVGLTVARVITEREWGQDRPRRV